MNREAGSLQGINVLVTRPAHQSVFLAEGIRSLGGHPVIFPVLEISDIEDKTPLLALIHNLDAYDMAIFVSPNAVHKAMQLIQSNRVLPPKIKIAVVGKGSADTLKEYGVNHVIMPNGRFDSEALLALTEMLQVSGKRIVIFRGNGGRPLLGDTLKARGALVEYAECYRRGKPDVDPAELLSIWSQGKINAVIITSSEGLHNLFDIIGQLGQQLLKMTPVFAVHERIVRTAREAGLKNVVQTAAVGDKGLLLCLQDYFDAIKKSKRSTI